MAGLPPTTRPQVRPDDDEEKRKRAAKAFGKISKISIVRDPNIPSTGGEGERIRRKIGATGNPGTLLGSATRN